MPGSPPARALIRPEEPSDIPAVRAVNRRAFGRPAETALVDALRDAGKDLLSLVALFEGRVAGHILFSPVELVGSARPASVAVLAPVAVLPELQRRGIGSLLVAEGLRRLRERGLDGVVVLGHPDYYPRFGFVPAMRFGIRGECDAPEGAFMALELHPGALAGCAGTARFAPEFAAV